MSASFLTSSHTNAGDILRSMPVGTETDAMIDASLADYVKQ
ncbi:MULTISPECIES: hypothetical protein [unclassified Bradyrhizobium]